MQSSSLHFVHLCKMLVQQMERFPLQERPQKRDQTLDSLMDQLLHDGLVFDRGFAGQIHDQLLVDGEPENDEAIQHLRQQIKLPTYLSNQLIDDLGHRMSALFTAQ